MPRKTVMLVMLIVLLWTVPTVAFAWSNGPNGGDGFGTHDWVLYEALKTVQPSWVVTETALVATDDPDTQLGSADKPNHFYLVSGSYRGGPETIASLYREVVSAYRSGDTTSASQRLGVMSHYYADLCVPFHTRDGLPETALHLQYELEVNQLTNEPGENAQWLTRWGRSKLPDIRARAVDAAMVSRATYPTLSTNYLLGGFNLTSEMVTRAVLTRAVNDLADIVRAVPKGEGVSEPVKIKASVSHRYPSTESAITATARCADAKGNPVEAARVQFTWNYPTGSRTVTTYSGRDGVARATADTGALVLGRRVPVQARQASGVQGMAASSSWFVPTDVIGYMKTSVSNRYPSQGTAVTAETVCLNRAGQPIPGLLVTYTWHHKTSVIAKTVTTDSRGIARHKRNIGGSGRGYRVAVRASVPAGGTVRTGEASFVPSNNIATMESTVSTFTPAQNKKVTVRTKCTDANGLPITGVPVTFTWRYRSTTAVDIATTDSQGVARSTRNIKKATRGYAVHVTSSARSGSSTKTAMTWFTPR